MKKILTLLTFIIQHSTFNISHAQAEKDTMLYSPSVLLEMFSSEGCSSCPLGDKFMQQIINIADSNEQPVFVLDYHVEVWDNSGWKDRFSDSVWTRRQQIYMEKTNQPALFTPMLIVNGKYNIAAGDKKTVGGAISHILKTPIPVRMDISPAPTQGGIKINYELKGNFDSTQLVFALAYKEVSSNVTAGENAGQTLMHHHVVKRLETMPVKDAKGSYDFLTDEETYKTLGDYILVVFLQNQFTWQVYATEQLNFGKR